MDNKQIKIQMLEEDCEALEKKQYEFNAILSIIGYLAKDSIIDYESMQEELNEAERRGIALELEKAIVTNKYCPEGYNGSEADWEADFYNSTINFTFPRNRNYNGKNFTYKVAKEDIDTLQLLQYEYNISLTVYTYLKETYNVNTDVLKEYLKVITAREFELQKCKSEISNKYKPQEVDLQKYDWSIDFIKEIIIYKGVNK